MPLPSLLLPGCEKMPANPDLNYTPPGTVPYTTKPGDNWWTLAERPEVKAMKPAVDALGLCVLNYRTKMAAEINWFLRNKAGCTQTTPDKKNYKFAGGEKISLPASTKTPPTRPGALPPPVQRGGPDVDVYVVADNTFDIVMWIDGFLTLGETGVMGVTDMVAKLGRLCSDGTRLAELRIVGHGNETGQYVGKDWLNSKSVELWRPELAKMSRLFGSKGHVIMGGCRVGRGGSFLLALSNIWNVPVSGFTALQRPVLPGDQGGRTTCFITCTRSGYSFADSFDEVQLDIMNRIQQLSTPTSSPVAPDVPNGRPGRRF